MTTSLPRHIPDRAPTWRQQAGAMIVEFALVLMIFLMALLGVMEFGRWLFTLNAAAEATRWGARLAVVCGSSQEKIQTRVGVMLRSGNGTLDVTYPDVTCVTPGCMVTVKLVGATFTPMVPFLGGAYGMPDFSTTLSRESMGSVLEGGSPVLPDICPAP